MSIDQSVQYYWNSNSRFNKPVKIIGVNDENYAVEADGHVFVVPKANITPSQKVFLAPSTTAPRPEAEYLFTLTSEEWELLTSIGARGYDSWIQAARELRSQSHWNRYTNEWFVLSVKTAAELLDQYSYGSRKYINRIDEFLPCGSYYKTVVRQLWEEQLRRDGIVPQ